MTIAPSRNFTTTSLLGGVLLLLCALTFYYFAVLRIDYHKTALLDLGPYPDAVEYFAQAKAMLKEGWPSIQIGYDKLPSRYPFGYPALMLPWLKILREADSVLAPFRTNQTIGLLLLLGVFGFYTYLARPLTGGFAAILLATLPGFFTYCRSSMSEISASALIVLSFMFAYLGLKEERRWKIYLSAIFLGLSVNVRIQSLFFAPSLLAMALFPTKGTRLRWFLHCAAVPIVFLLVTSPLLVMNTIQFGSPLKTGYDFWVPYWSENHLLFSLRYVPSNLAALWREFALEPLGFHTANIFGTGTCFVPAFVLLACAGLFFVRIDRFAICAFLAGLTFLAVTLSHNSKLVDARYYLPLLILIIAVAVLPVTWAAENLLAGKRIIPSLAIFLLFAAVCLGYPSQSGYPAKRGRLQAWDALHFTKQPRKSTHFVAQKRFVELFGSHPGIVLSDIDPAYLNALLPHSFFAAPIDRPQSRRFSKIWRYGRPQAVALVSRGLRQGLPIYVLFNSVKEMIAQESRLPVVPGYSWSLLNSSPGKAVILNLIPDASYETRVPPG
jgi:hypothetical protein